MGMVMALSALVILALTVRVLVRDRLTGALREGAGWALVRLVSAVMPVAVLVIDIDGMRDTNEARGFAAGDRLLARSGAAIRRALGGRGIVARLAERDEFVVVSWAGSGQRMRRVVRAVLRARGIAVVVGCAETEERGYTAFKEALFAARVIGDLDLRKLRNARSWLVAEDWGGRGGAVNPLETA